jgi:hypothetical protein
MSDALNQAERCRELAEGCRRLVALTPQSKSKTEIAICGWQPPQAMGFQGGSI